MTRARTASPQDQLKAFKAAGKSGFTATQPNRQAYCTQLQKLLFDEHGTAANDLDDGDSGCDGDGVVRKVRKRREDQDGEDAGEGSSSGGRKRKAGPRMCEMNGYVWPATKTFNIEKILDKKVEKKAVGKVRHPRCNAARPHRPRRCARTATTNARG